jgi:hypothetical protein
MNFFQSHFYQDLWGTQFTTALEFGDFPFGVTHCSSLQNYKGRNAWFISSMPPYILIPCRLIKRKENLI